MPTEVFGPVPLGVRDLEPADEDVVEPGPGLREPPLRVDSSRSVGDVTTVTLKSPASTTGSPGFGEPGRRTHAARRSSASASAAVG